MSDGRRGDRPEVDALEGVTLLKEYLIRQEIGWLDANWIKPTVIVTERWDWETPANRILGKIVCLLSVAFIYGVFVETLWSMYCSFFGESQ